ncbi:hypothetical protein ACFU98_42815 [Streptomyces sp. NPDC057575]|uniref:hypothetical protein n=1 Tax=unclassified Streptomyces TaxID=2593676 RepID=UPI00368EFD05
MPGRPAAVLAARSPRWPPGYERQPVLLLTRPLPMRAADEACLLCGYWMCRCGNGVVAAEETIVLSASPCGTCAGQDGRMVDTSSDGVTRQNWVSCQACRGSGVAQ